MLSPSRGNIRNRDAVHFALTVRIPKPHPTWLRQLRVVFVIDYARSIAYLKIKLPCLSLKKSVAASRTVQYYLRTETDVVNIPTLHSIAIKRRRKKGYKRKGKQKSGVSPSVQTASCNFSMDPTYKARSALVFKLTNFSKLSIHLLTTDSGSSQGLHAQAFRKDCVKFIQLY